MENQIVKTFGNKIRVRVCGILVNNDGILLAKHHGIGEDGVLWSPPGGGVDFGSSLKENLIREFLEETGLVITVKKFLGVSEYLAPPLHAVELFFWVNREGGKLASGYDPELPPEKQIIKEVRFVTFEELLIIPNKQKHQFLHNVDKASDLEKNPVFIDEI